ncbi:MAG: imidazole glycerol phosphate synthase subunit HisH [Rhizobiales bacterium]|nr:imidazole glycerol phosphate synthase subunit HisH [Hyphomicrobiales bacterium]
MPRRSHRWRRRQWPRARAAGGSRRRRPGWIGGCGRSCCTSLRSLCRLSERGLEKTVTSGLGWIAGDVKVIEPANPALKVPQIGWNTLGLTRDHPLFAGIPTGEKGLHAYFVHSYHLDAKNEADVLALADYGGPVTAAVARDNYAGTQFHPEKSQALGLALIANFLKWKP